MKKSGYPENLSDQIDASVETPDASNENIKKPEGKGILGGLLDQARETLEDLKRIAKEKDLERTAGALLLMGGIATIFLLEFDPNNLDHFHCATASGQQAVEGLLRVLKSISFDSLAILEAAGLVTGSALMNHSNERDHQEEVDELNIRHKKEADELKEKIAALEEKLKSKNGEAENSETAKTAGPDSEAIDDKSSL